MPPKVKTLRSERYLSFIRTMPCVFCGYTNQSEAAHVRFRNKGGMGLKPSDFRAVPLCRACHGMQHQVGEKTFWGLDGMNSSLEQSGEASDRAIVETLTAYLISRKKTRAMLEVLEALAALEGEKKGKK